KGSPAEKSGLRAKDVILKVDNQEIKGQTLTEIVEKIRGEKGLKVKLKIQREAESFDVTITQDTIPVDSVYATIDETDATVGKIQLTSFSATTANEFKEAVEELREKGAKSFVIDLRQNPGGMLTEVEKIASMLLKDDAEIVRFE